MGYPAPEMQLWIIEPLVEVGLDLEQIKGLVFDLGFQAVVGGGAVRDVGELVRDQPPEVQVAWRRAVLRMIAAEEPDGST